MEIYSTKNQYFQRPNHDIIEIVQCESGRVAQKVEYANIKVLIKSALEFAPFCCEMS